MRHVGNCRTVGTEFPEERMSAVERGAEVGKSQRRSQGSVSTRGGKTKKNPVDDFIAGGCASITSKLVLQVHSRLGLDETKP